MYATYNELMKNGWRMKEIDEMDMLGFLRLRAWDVRREQEKKKPRQRFIDEVWPGVKPELQFCFSLFISAFRFSSVNLWQLHR